MLDWDSSGVLEEVFGEFCGWDEVLEEIFLALLLRVTVSISDIMYVDLYLCFQSLLVIILDSLMYFSVFSICCLGLYFHTTPSI